MQLGRKRAQSTSPRTHDPSTRATTRQPYSNRTNLDRSPCRPNTTTKTKTTPSPARQKGPVARRKSTSAATATPREFSSYDLSSLPPEAFATSTTTTTTTTARSKPPPPSHDDPSRPPPPSPSRRRQPRQLEDDDQTEFKDGDGSFPYFTADATLRVSSDTSVETAHPLIYKNSRGELTDRGREEDKIIPTIANRLEAERRQKLVELAQRQQQQQQRQRRRQHDDDDPTTQSQEQGQGGVDRHEQRRRQEEAVDKDVGPQENPSRSSSVAIPRDGVTTATTRDESSRPLAELSSSSSPANEKTAAATTTPRVGVAVADNTDSNDKTRHSDVVDKDANKATCCACVIS